MEHDVINKTEWRLKSYYRSKASVERFDRILSETRERITRLGRDIKECNYTLDVQFSGSRLDSMPRGTSNTESSIERSLMKAHEQKEQELGRLIEREAHLVEIISRNDERLKLMDEALETLSDEYRMMARLKYGKGLPLRKIGDEMMMDHTNIYKHLKKMLVQLSETLEQMGETLLESYDKETDSLA